MPDNFKDAQQTPNYVTLIEACGILHCSERTARRLIAKDRLRVAKVGRRVLISMDSIRFVLGA